MELVWRALYFGLVCMRGVCILAYFKTGMARGGTMPSKTA